MKIPKEVRKVIQALQGAGIETYLVGKGVRAAITEEQSDEWEIVTKAEDADIKKLVRNAQIDKEEGSNLLAIVPVSADKKSEDDVEVLIGYLDMSIDDYLQSFDFTAEAVAYDLAEDVLIDPFDGSLDIEEEIIKMIGDPRERISENPMLLMDAIKIIVDTNFDIQKATFEAMKAESAKMQEISKENRREAFYYIINAKFAGRGLRMMMNANMMQYIVGPKIFRGMKKNERKALTRYVNNVDRAQRHLDRRLTVFYLCFLKDRYLKAADYLGCNDEMKAKMMYANDHLPDLYFMRKKADMKHFLVKYGLEKFQFVDAISKIQCDLFELNKSQALSRHRMMTEIVSRREAVYKEDLKINATDIMKAGITDDPERAEQILDLVLKVVHEKPSYNIEKMLMYQACKFESSKVKRAISTVHRILKYRD